MNSIYFLIPLAGLFLIVAIAAFFWAVRGGQFDDLDTPGMRVLFDDDLPLQNDLHKGERR